MNHDRSKNDRVRSARAGLPVRSGVRAGQSKVKTSDKQQKAILDFIKG